MLTAIHKETGERIFASQLTEEEGHELNKNRLIVDPIFEQRCSYKRAHERSDHFVRSHFFCTGTKTANNWMSEFIPDDDYFKESKRGISVRETVHHLLGKAYLREWYASTFGWALSEIELERRIKMDCGRWRIADIAFGLTDDGPRKVVEVQISPISVEYLADRIADYNSQDIDSDWWLGPKARSPEVISYFEEYEFNGFYTIDFKDQKQSISIGIGGGDKETTSNNYRSLEF